MRSTTTWTRRNHLHQMARQLRNLQFYTLVKHAITHDCDSSNLHCNTSYTSATAPPFFLHANH